MADTLTAAEARDIIVRTMTEKTLQAFVVQAAKAAGFNVYHTFDSRRSEPGFPDLVMIRGTHMIVAELKRHGKAPTAAQRSWLDAFSGVPGEISVHVWSPEDWVDGTIIRALEQETA